MLEDRLIGPPGTGKTTTLAAAIAHHAKERGSDRVIAVSHTKAAAAELAGRHMPLPRENIGTLHSFAYRAIGSPPVVDSKAFSQEHRWKMGADIDTEEVAFRGTAEGDKLLSEYERQRNLCSRQDYWPADVVDFARAWEGFKADTGTIDFTDMISFASSDTDCAPQEPEIMVVDELQDTSRLQWKLIHRWGAHCARVITAGDSDQSLYQFAGAEPEYFLEVRPERQRVLEQSYRVPRAVHAIALPWIQQITNREDIRYLPRDFEGCVERSCATIKYPEALIGTIGDKLAQGKTVMVMAACGYMIAPLVAVLRREAIPFANPWRTKSAGWNPLHDKGENSTIAALKAFLIPHTENRWWTKREAVRWVAITKGLLGHGGKKTLEQYLPDKADPEDVLRTLQGCFACPEDFGRFLVGPPDCLDALEGALLKSKEDAAEFPFDVMRKHGIEKLAESPRLFVGTIHSFKGAEADCVFVWPDLSFSGFQEWVGGGRDSILRTFYVAMTRAREELYLCAPSSDMAVWG